MIDVTRYELDDIYQNDEYTDIYFFSPMDMYTICLTVCEEGHYMQGSPTVDEDGMLSDVDWSDLEDGVDYNDETVRQLLWLAGKENV